ncbi:hypothetical protein TcWFU_009892 [Taenia crassiceps]|uniref:Fibronectin type-III domain-containing protein n=1 Tax=Taenia crassiceps TaxID=6207 RepID=A0ABR4Q364_9CEST
MANFYNDKRVYELEGLEPSMKYAVTVRGIKLPDISSEMSDPLVFETMDACASVPRNVKLAAVDPYTVKMTWNPPAEPQGARADVMNGEGASTPASADNEGSASHTTELPTAKGASSIGKSAQTIVPANSDESSSGSVITANKETSLVHEITTAR